MLKCCLKQGSGLSRPGLCFIKCLLLSSLVIQASCAGRLEPLPAPSPLPNVRPEFRTAAFWSAHYPGSKKMLMKEEEIEALNETILASELGVKDIFKLPGSIKGSYLNEAFIKTRAHLENKGYYSSQDRKLDKDYYDPVFLNMGYADQVTRLRYGIIATATNARAIPTFDLAKNKGTRGSFDHFQVAHIDPGTPVAVLHQSRDAKWFYVESDCVSGWVLSSDVAMGEKPKVQYFAQARPLVITGKSIPFYFDPGLREFAIEMDMGSTLPYLLRSGPVYEVVLPCRAPDGSLFFRSGYTDARSDVNRGFISYTLDNVYSQAFKLLDIPYVWGSKQEGSEDCSGFIMSVFRCFGFRIARNSSNQARSNSAKWVQVSQMTESEKMQLLKGMEGRPAFLYQPGHIMLYLGYVEGRAYAIHSMWSYEEPEQGQERVRLVRRIAVADLNTGEGTGSGSYLHKLVSVMPLD